MVVTSNSKHPQRAPTSRHLGSVRRLSTTISIYFLPVTWRKHPVTSVQNAKRKLDKSTWFLTASPKKKEGFEMLGMPERFRIGAGMSLASLTSMICMITSVAWDGKPAKRPSQKKTPVFAGAILFSGRRVTFFPRSISLPCIFNLWSPGCWTLFQMLTLRGHLSHWQKWLTYHWDEPFLINRDPHQTKQIQ